MQKQIIVVLTLVVFGFSLPALAQTKSQGSNTYLVVGSEGPGFTSPEEAIQILEKGILPTFDALMKLEKKDEIDCIYGKPLSKQGLISHFCKRVNRGFEVLGPKKEGSLPDSTLTLTVSI